LGGREMEVSKNLEIIMIAYNLLVTFEKTSRLECLALPFARKGIQLFVEGEIEEGFESLFDATNMIHMVKDEPEYACNYYDLDYLVEERRLDKRNKKNIINVVNEQEIDMEKVSYKEEEQKINQIYNKVQNSDNLWKGTFLQDIL
jgi:hypothetical protein